MHDTVQGTGALLLAAILLSQGCSQPDEPGKIVFTSNRDGNLEIYTALDDGTEQFRVTDHPASDDSPSWSPDGTSILFASDRDGAWNIFLVRADGTGLQQLTTGTGSNTAPSWAMDGSAILFSSSRDAINGDLYLMDPDGGNIRRLTNAPDVKENSVMTRDGSTVFLTVNHKEMRSVASLDAGAGQFRRLTPEGSQSLSVQLSRDERRLLYISNRAGSYDVYSLELETGVTTQLTSDPANILTPAWGKSTDEILYSKHGTLYRRGLSDGTETVLSNNGDASPRWTSR
jgi:Tol biopolymer transport system component